MGAADILANSQCSIPKCVWVCEKKAVCLMRKRDTERERERVCVCMCVLCYKAGTYCIPMMVSFKGVLY